MKWFGSKWRMAPRLIKYFPRHMTYVEPFGGGANVLLRKPRSPIEVYNDLDERIVNVFRVLRDPVLSEQLRRAAALTPFARVEHTLSYEPSDDPVEAARRFVFRSFASHGSSAYVRSRTGFRSRDKGNGHSSMAWANWPDEVPAFCARLAGVVIECRPALEVIEQHDDSNTLIYLDPPYVHDTRKMGESRDGEYLHEMSDTDHAALLDRVRRGQGMVAVSGYPSDLYNDMLAGWRSVEFNHYAGGTNAAARARTEVLWLNPAAEDALQPTLFDGTRDG